MPIIIGLSTLSSLPAKTFGEQRGYLMSRACPFSCRTQGIDKKHCKDWRTGNTCYVEDLSRPANNPAPSIQIPPLSNQPSIPKNPGYNPWGGQTNGYQPDPQGSQDCRTGGYLGRPRVTVYKAKATGNMFGDKYKVRGEVEGVCLVEAGYFEAGRKRENIPVVTTRDFRRFEFEVKISASERPEIRVYNANGDMNYVEIDSRELGAGGGMGGW